jgi:hypothetical protein
MVKLRQARVRESLELIKIRDFIFYMCRLPTPGPGTAWTALTWPGNHPYPSPLIDYWMGITWLLPSHRLAYILKEPGEEKHVLSASWLPPEFLFPIF